MPRFFCNHYIIYHGADFPLRKILANTLMQVNELVGVGKERWLYVTVPVYDTPMNMKGWIKAADTVPFTKDKEKQVQSDVTIKTGTIIFEGWDFPGIIEIG